MIYQILGIIIGATGLIISLKRFREGRISPGISIFWVIVWLSLIIVSLNPTATSILADIIGIGRGLDLILILAVIGAYYILFKIYTMVENLEMEITELTREIALREDEEEK